MGSRFRGEISIPRMAEYYYLPRAARLSICGVQFARARVRIPPQRLCVYVCAREWRRKNRGDDSDSRDMVCSAAVIGGVYRDRGESRMLGLQ